ncbi:amino acid adenylation domain-containing protein [Pseudomonas fakonensis]|uniref:Amino acid adenylation domain-containing protein n=1 Tax=Pseudomonas fakonensis TaxID=2842355 RepID=A0ABX8N1B2_9PSED|nr:non-ribosomal peptide synthetase [Pseudomonas fakonensis]QXH49541.1 amino acid adenylation domain-containing protein [Pseudomonas fakonensis]
MTQLADRMQALARRFAALAFDERRALQGRMREQGLAFELLPIPPREEASLPVQASFSQQRLWSLWQLDPQSTAYNQPALLSVSGALDIQRLAQSLQALVQRHEALRTNFRQDERQVLQVIHAGREVSLEQLDLRASSQAEREQVAAELAARPFDLEHDLLLRASLLHTGEQQWTLVFCTHHIVTDAWSMPILIEEVLRHYREQTPAAELPIQYADHARWQRLWLEAGEAERQLGYWRERLGVAEDSLELPADHPRPARRSGRGARLAIELPAGQGAAVRQLAAVHGCTPFMVLLATLQVLLMRYGAGEAVRVGTPVANRTRAEVEGLIGFFVNTQVLQVELDGRHSFSQVLAQVRQRVLEAQANQDLPFEHLVDALQPQRSLDRTPLFQVLFNHQVAAGQGNRWQLPGVELAPLQVGAESARFDLTLSTEEQGDQLQASLLYATDLFEARTIERLGQHWAQLLDAALAEPGRAIESLPIGAAPQASQADTQVSGPWLHQRFAAQAAQHPQRIALVEGARSLTYAELDARANRLARRLQASGVAPGEAVALSAERRLETLVGLLAVLKAGACYVALDPQYPRPRLEQMLADSGACRVLAPGDQAERFAGLPGVTVHLLDDASQPGDGPCEAPSAPVVGAELAYVIFTSGSTGKPKAVGISHAALANYLDGIEQRLPLAQVQSMALVSTLAADLGHTVLFGALAAGRTLHLIDADTAVDGEAFAAYMQLHQVDALKIVPSHLGALLGSDNAGVLPRRCLVLGGEASPPALLQRIRAQAPDCALVNHYGPTETTVGVFTCLLEQLDTAAPLGAPLPNLRAQVLDGALQQAALGSQGELYLGGAGLARGYLGQPGLTAERFVPDPFGNGQRLYRTGDRVRYRADDQLQYLGRADQQLKIRGYRVEPGEIEQQLLAHADVAECVVAGVPGANGTQLAAYVVAADGATLDADTLKAHLRERLSAHQVPAHVLALAALPLTANGKLDRRALPLPAAPSRQPATQGDARQQRIAALWLEVLRSPQVGLDDNFFELGGDSIVAIQLVSRARAAGITFSARDVFEHQSVRSLAAHAGFDQAPIVAEQPAAEGPCLLLPIQQAFFAADPVERHHWNQSLLLQPRQALDGAVLEQALVQLWRHHDVLRSCFSQGPQGWQAHIPAAVTPPAGLLWQRHCSSLDELAQLLEQAQRSFDLARGEVLRAVLATLPDGSQRLLLSAHHLVVDGVSWRILLEDLQACHDALVAGSAPRLPARSSSVQRWGQVLADWAQAAPQRATLEYWEAQLPTSDRVLPQMRSQGPARSADRQVAVTRLDAGLTARLLQGAAAAYRTQVNDLLLAGLARVLCRWVGESSVSVQLEGHGREELCADLDLSRTLGWFTSLFPVRLQPAASPAATIMQVKEQLRAVPDRGLGFAALKYLGTAQDRARLQGLPVPRITFNYLGQVDGTFNEQALLRPAAEGKGAERSPEALLGNWLTISGQVYQGVLALEWSFSGQMFLQDDIQRLADAYAEELALLVEHCLDPAAGALTPSDVPLAGLDQAGLDGLGLVAREVADLYPLSPMQQGMLFHSLYQAEAGAYINQLHVEIGGLDPARLRAAWEQTVQAHDILRSGFLWGDDQAQPLQVVRRQVPSPLVELDWRGRTDLPAALQALCAEQRSTPFDLTRAPLLRVCLVQVAQDRHVMLYTHHHILMDGWSSAQVMGEVMQRYHGGAPAQAPQPLREYIRWLQAQDATASEAFWREQLAPLPAPTRLLDCLPGTGGAEHGMGNVDRTLDVVQTQRLEVFARSQRVTLNTLVQGAWALLLQRLAGQQAVCFGVTVSGRPAQLPGIEQQIGLFINTLPMLASPSPAQPLGEWLRSLQAGNLAMREHEHTPLYDIQRWVGQGGEALFDHILVFENFPMAEALQEGGGALSFGTVHQHERTSYPLTIAAGVGQTLQLQMSHDLALLPVAVVEGLAEQLCNLLLAMPTAADSAVAELPVLGQAQNEARLRHERARVDDCAALVPVHLRLQAQALLQPQACAVVCDGQQLSYAELNRRANRLAHALRGRGVGPEHLVGICMGRSVELPVAVLAVLKAGAGYVPLDPDYPQERLQAMVEDSGISLLLGEAALLRAHADAGVATLALDQPLAQLVGQDNDPAWSGLVDSLAYVIFTSGSTGRPKGVALTHRALARHTEAAIQALELVASDKVLQFATFNFDPFVEQLFATLAVGATLVMRGQSVWSSSQFRDAVDTQGITVADLSTAYWATIARDLADSGPHALASLRLVLCGGEAMPGSAVQDWARALGRTVTLLNAYGPTEATVTATLQDCTPWLANPQAVPAVLPIGQALAGRALYLDDGQGAAAARHGAGEVCIGGELLARGYQGRPGLTAERFVPDPDGAPGSRRYRTGDLAWRDGEQALWFLGRGDEQVKIRGFRVEPAEIEARLREHAQVREALVQVHEAAGGTQLVAYLVLAAPVEDAALKAWVAATLPGYMVPARLLRLEQMPLSPSGKVDRRALPLPEAQADGPYRAPGDETQQQVAAIWQQVLQLERVGLDDNFFELGGHSLLATQVIVRLRGQLGVEVSLENLFMASNLEAFCAHVRGLRDVAQPVEDELAKSLEALKRLSSAELEKLIS